jgi:hypothetical protein
VPVGGVAEVREQRADLFVGLLVVDFEDQRRPVRPKEIRGAAQNFALAAFEVDLD